MSKIIDTSEPAAKSRSHLKVRLVIIIVVVVLAVIGGVALLTKRQSMQRASDTVSEQDDISAASDEANQIATTKSTGEALKYYDQKISDAEGEEKVQLLLGKAAIAFNAGDFDAALQAASDANAIKESTGTLNMVARAYEGKGDKARALEYYQKALTALPLTDLTKRQKIELETKISELSGR